MGLRHPLHRTLEDDVCVLTVYVTAGGTCGLIAPARIAICNCTPARNIVARYSVNEAGLLHIATSLTCKHKDVQASAEHADHQMMATC